MADIRTFYLHAESFLKRKVDFATMHSLSAESFEKFIVKMAIELSRETHPKRVYGLTRDDVCDIVTEVLDAIQTVSLVGTGRRCYCYETQFDGYRLVFARTKKAAEEIIRSVPITSLSMMVRKTSLQKVVAIHQDHVITEKGERRDINPWRQTINLYELRGEVA
ncbi:hypothetical protein [Paenibacillus sp. DMB20]|uniref:hypothetical protein n=1 Tax=Paenibacillus sp. DMB20 TaxID=1642570 RepID=UPI0006274F89|nr:hypothetical protein [Paenibacillus sp. DMB20]KKO54499.1 hypothetical protein XI25_06850 [Paenibacillus sp. DMB20]